jgi:hypothetical protein
MKFVPIIRNTKLSHCSDEFCNNIIDYYQWLNNTIDTLIEEGKWSLDKDYKKTRLRNTNQPKKSQEKEEILPMETKFENPF